MKRVRCRENDGVDRGIGEDRLEAVGESKIVLAGEGSDIVGDGAGRGRDETDGITSSLDGLDKRLAPPTKANDGRVDHLSAALPVPGFLTT